METLLRILEWEMERPGMYGCFHLLSFALAFAAAALLCRSHRRRPHSPAQVRGVVFRTAVLVLALEIYKHVVYHLSWGEGPGLQLDVQWYIFPWQFCMFFISPYCEPSLPVYSLVQAFVPYPFCLIIYVTAFTLAAMGISRLCAGRRAKGNAAA